MQTVELTPDWSGDSLSRVHAQGRRELRQDLAQRDGVADLASPMRCLTLGDPARDEVERLGTHLRPFGVKTRHLGTIGADALDER